MTWEQFLEHVTEHYSRWPTPAIAIFEVFVVVVAIATYRYLNARVQRVGQHFALIAIGVFLLEFFTAPMWENRNLGVWAYVYSDVTWILTLSWTTLIIGTIYVVDRTAGSAARWQRFALYLGVLTPLSLMFESVSVGLGIRVYSPETLDAAGPLRIPILNVPAAGLYYVPVFMALVLTFYQHWLPTIEPGGVAQPRPSVLRRVALATLAVLMFELIVEPMATNANFPAWSYLYRDITIVMTALWVGLMFLVTFLVDRLLPKLEYRLRFAAYLVLVAVIATPIEGWFISAGYRVYGPSATADFLGFRTIVGNLPIEVVAAIPIYLALVITFVRYWDGSVVHGLRLQPRAVVPGTAGMSVPVPGAG